MGFIAKRRSQGQSSSPIGYDISEPGIVGSRHTLERDLIRKSGCAGNRDLGVCLFICRRGVYDLIPSHQIENGSLVLDQHLVLCST